MTPTKLFSTVTLGGTNSPIQLQHRVAMAPLTRCRADGDGVQPAYAATYYGQRASAGGLIVAEATNISATARGYYGSPGIYTQQQIDAWKAVTSAVHDKQGKIFLQLWHTGRVGHPSNQPNGQLPVSSSARPFTDPIKQAVTSVGRQPFGTPRALETNEIPDIVADYRKATVNALAAGFDGVEIHAANGYLIEQFLCNGVNDRTDAYGGSIENRARLLFEVVEAILESVDSSRVGIRLSPFNVLFSCTDSSPLETYSYVINKLNDYNLAYVHLIEPRGFHPTGALAPPEGVLKIFRKIYRGVLLTASGYTRETAIKVVADGDADIVVFGRYFITNPDLVKRLQLDAPLTPFEGKNFYGGGETGYTDYPFLEDN
ncbi:TPA: hypothetical protein N0F65_005889 [Lagenidium giganteum]|uniref:NADH:flavin oxidoreductase/NADH oxidase N-terminal domain-containing protein n=1 Tax=Lagenidium giganteum TaxID=4803 RepID=A0AAV2YQH4_9STRA|nr:TPA: hypothetical protein N0F65_005889 [Lagenidium giganteum]